MTSAIYAALFILVVFGALIAVIPAYSCPRALLFRLYLQGVFAIMPPCAILLVN